jgi:type VI secretion system protein ImpF
MDDTRLAPSVLDRLVDAERLPAPGDRRAYERYARRVILRDLAMLLNCRNQHGELPDEFVEARDSVLTYGLPDFTGVDVRHDPARDQICELVERAVTTFEPRLRDVRVRVESQSDAGYWIRLRLEGRLAALSGAAPVAFAIAMPIGELRCEMSEAS